MSGHVMTEPEYVRHWIDFSLYVYVWYPSPLQYRGGRFVAHATLRDATRSERHVLLSQIGSELLMSRLASPPLFTVT